MTKPRCCFFAVNILFTLRIIVVDAELIAADGQMWTRKDTAAAAAAAAGPKPDGRNVISPRMDFDEWTPLGRGDPLKNDPTFDYLPPVLDRVHYWKSPPAPVNRAQYAAPSAVASSHAVGANYNRRFFLTDLSSPKKEPSSGYVQYAPHKRPQVAAVYHLPKTPLPMLTPPPYQRPQPQTTITATAAAAATTTTITTTTTTTTVQPTDVYSPYADAVNSVAAESKQPPPTVRVPPPPTVRAPQPPQRHTTTSAPLVSSVLSHSVIKTLLENEVDRTAAATTGRTTAASSDPLFAHYKQSAAGAGTPPPYLIIQGHSKVKTYGLVSKPDDLSAAARQPAAVHEHNHVGNRPDEPNRRKRDGPR